MSYEFLTVLSIHNSSLITHSFFEFGAKIHFLFTSETKVEQKPILCRLIFNDRMADVLRKCLSFIAKCCFLRFYTEGV
jgi:hypothetical protein